MRGNLFLLSSGVFAAAVSNVCSYASTLPLPDDMKYVVHEVFSGAELMSALASGKRCSDGKLRIRLAKNVYVTADLKLPSGTVLDLNGHILYMGPDATIIVGNKTVIRRDKEVIHQYPRR